jgi:hypothetical protein
MVGPIVVDHSSWHVWGKLTGLIHHNVKILYAFVVPIPQTLQFDISLWEISNFLHIALSQTNVKSWS